MNVLTSRGPGRRQQRGAALVIGLILLLVMTVLAVASMSSATMGLQMTVNAQSANGAFQAAEQAISATMETYLPDTTVAEIDLPDIDVATSGARVATQVRFDAVNGCTEVPDGGFSLGEGVAFKAYHFDVTSRAEAGRGGSVEAAQSYYVVAPQGGSCTPP